MKNSRVSEFTPNTTLVKSTNSIAFDSIEAFRKVAFGAEFFGGSAKEFIARFIPKSQVDVAGFIDLFREIAPKFQNGQFNVEIAFHDFQGPIDFSGFDLIAQAFLKHSSTFNVTFFPNAFGNSLFSSSFTGFEPHFGFESEKDFMFFIREAGRH